MIQILPAATTLSPHDMCTTEAVSVVNVITLHPCNMESYELYGYVVEIKMKAEFEERHGPSKGGRSREVQIREGATAP